MNILKKNKSLKIYAVTNGMSLGIENVNDITFANKLMGDGIAIIPTDNNVFSPCNGKISVLHKTKHAFAITSEDGVEILVHIGIDTVNLEGEGFISHVSQGDYVKKGDPIITFNKEEISAKGIDCTIMMILLNEDTFSKANFVVDNNVTAKKDVVIEITK